MVIEDRGALARGGGEGWGADDQRDAVSELEVGLLCAHDRHVVSRVNKQQATGQTNGSETEVGTHSPTRRALPGDTHLNKRDTSGLRISQAQTKNNLEQVTHGRR